MPNWGEVLEEIQEVKQKGQEEARSAVDRVRRKYLKELHLHTGRNIIAYYSGFLSKPGLEQGDINDEDKNGFMMAVHKLDRSKGLDLIIHTPGGRLSATQSIVHYLRQMFGKNIRAIVPQIAMSAGTILACSCKEILMAKHSNLGPIDPQLSGIPAQGVLLEFQEAWEEIKKDESKRHVWSPIIGQYRPTFLIQCKNSIALSNAFVMEQLEAVMFDGEANAKERAAEIVKKLSDFSGNKAHDRHIHIDECESMGLDIVKIESDQGLQDLILTVHHCYMHSLMNTASIKMIENHLGTAIVKQVT